LGVFPTSHQRKDPVGGGVRWISDVIDGVDHRLHQERNDDFAGDFDDDGDPSADHLAGIAFYVFGQLLNCLHSSPYQQT
jgi:hypothetical protein